MQLNHKLREMVDDEINFALKRPQREPSTLLLIDFLSKEDGEVSLRAQEQKLLENLQTKLSKFIKTDRFEFQKESNTSAPNLEPIEILKKLVNVPPTHIACFGYRSFLALGGRFSGEAPYFQDLFFPFGPIKLACFPSVQELVLFPQWRQAVWGHLIEMKDLH